MAVRGATSKGARRKPPKKKWRYVFNGSVWPPSAFINLPGPVPVTLNGGWGLAGGLEVTLSIGQVVAVLDLEEEYPDLYTLRNIVEDFVATIPDCITLYSGFGWEITFLSVHDVANSVTLPFAPGVLSGADPEAVLKDAQHLFSIVWQSHDLRRALTEYRLGCKYPAQTGFHCGRAFEAIAHYFGPMRKNENIKKTRKVLCATLGVSRATNARIIAASAAARHGGTTSLTGEDRVQFLGVASELIRRFVEYYTARIEGKVPSVKPEF